MASAAATRSAMTSRPATSNGNGAERNRDERAERRVDVRAASRGRAGRRRRVRASRRRGSPRPRDRRGGSRTPTASSAGRRSKKSDQRDRREHAAEDDRRVRLQDAARRPSGWRTGRAGRGSPITRSHRRALGSRRGRTRAARPSTIADDRRGSERLESVAVLGTRAHPQHYRQQPERRKARPREPERTDEQHEVVQPARSG